MYNAYDKPTQFMHWEHPRCCGCCHYDCLKGCVCTQWDTPPYTGSATGTGALECPGSMVRCGVHKWESTDLAHAQTHPNDAPKLGVASSGNVTLECCLEQDQNTNTYETFFIRTKQHSIQYHN